MAVVAADVAGPLVDNLPSVVAAIVASVVAAASLGRSPFERKVFAVATGSGFFFLFLPGDLWMAGASM